MMAKVKLLFFLFTGIKPILRGRDTGVSCHISRHCERAKLPDQEDAKAVP